MDFQFPSSEQVKEWTEVFWGLGWRGLIAFAVIFGKEAWIHWLKVLADVVGSWAKRKGT